MTQIVKIPNKLLNNGGCIPVIGLGISRLNDDKKLVDAIKAAIDIGYRHLDCSWVYENENLVGKAINESIVSSNGKLKREDLFITDKLWHPFGSKQVVQTYFEESLVNLKTNYLDLLLCHTNQGYLEYSRYEHFSYGEMDRLIFSDIHNLESYQIIEDMFIAGKTKSIGLSNFNFDQTKSILSNCRIKPSVIQIELQPNFQNKQLLDLCEENNIAVAGYGVIGSDSRHWLKPDKPVLLGNPTIVKLSKKYGKTPAQICIKWALQEDKIAIVKGNSMSYLIENFDVFDFVMSRADLNEIQYGTNNKLIPFNFNSLIENFRPTY